MASVTFQTNQHVALIHALSISFELSVSAECPRMYRFQGFLINSLIFYLSSGRTFGLSNNFGKYSFLYLSYIRFRLIIPMLLPRLLPVPQINIEFGFPLSECSWSTFFFEQKFLFNRFGSKRWFYFYMHALIQLLTDIFLMRDRPLWWDKTS